jgi:hypothetical protein
MRAFFFAIPQFVCAQLLCFLTKFSSDCLCRSNVAISAKWRFGLAGLVQHS